MKHKTVVVITGATSGIGLACAQQYFAKGAYLSLCARNLEDLKKLQNQLDASGQRVFIQQIDVAKEEECKKFIAETIQKFGQINVLINNAGITMRALFKEVNLEVLKKIMDVNFWGAVYCTKFAMPYLLKSKGSIVGMSSVAGYKGLPTRSGYSASKFALEGWLESLRIENLKTGVHVLIARPGFTATNIRNTAMNASGNAQGESHKDEAQSMSANEVAKHVIQAIEKRSNYLLLTSNAHLTFWLNKFVPKWVDRQVFKFVLNEKDSPLK
jgi:short-subunit dehydrogenase